MRWAWALVVGLGCAGGTEEVEDTDESDVVDTDVVDTDVEETDVADTDVEETDDGMGETDSDDPSAAWLNDADAEAALTARADGLWFTSESDYPLVVVRIDDPGVALTAANVTTLLAPVYVQRPDTTLLAEREADEVGLGQVFDRYTVQEPWWEQGQIDQAPAWQALRATFEDELGDARAYRIGRRNPSGLGPDVDIFVLGRTSEGSWIGVWTVSIET